MPSAKNPATLPLVLLGLSLGACGGCGPDAPKLDAAKPQAVLVITIDTLRPDALGFIAGGGHTPELDRLSRESFRLPAAISPTPLTLPAHVSIFTGLEPPRHGVRDNGQVLGASPPTLAEALRAAGFRTGAVVSGYPLKKLFGLDRGFEHYDDAFAGAGASERQAPATTAAALAWLKEVTATQPAAPFFLWVHYYDPHAPYRPPGTKPGEAASDEREAYLGEVAAVDSAIRELLAGVANLAPQRSQLTLITADHGESLGEHGEATHGFFIYDSTVVVPALWHWPGGLAPGESRLPARLVDFAPTVLDLVGAPPWPRDAIDGVSLRPTLNGAAQELPAAYLESLQPWLGYGWAPLKGLRTADAKLIEAPTPELYALKEDPAEEKNRYAAESPEARALYRLLRERQALKPAAEAGSALDAETLATLRSLGYTGSVSSRASLPTEGLADPKDRVRQRVLLGLAEDALSSGQRPEALATLDVVLEKEPDNRYALLRLGQILAEAGDLKGAVPPLERLLRLDPDQPEARFTLADALSRSGQRDRAIEEWRELLARQPRRAAAWSNLGTMLLQTGKLPEAIGALERAFALESNNVIFRRNLATCQLQLAAVLVEVDRVKAAAALARALELEPGLETPASRQPKLAPLVAEWATRQDSAPPH